MHVNTSSLARWQVMMMVVQCSGAKIHERQSYRLPGDASKYILVKKIWHSVFGGGKNWPVLTNAVLKPPKEAGRSTFGFPGKSGHVHF